MLSDVIQITTTEDSVQLVCEDAAKFLFPKSDCAMLPIVHATTEELAIYLYGRILKGLDANYLLNRGIHTIAVNVAEAVGQDATFQLRIPTSDRDHASLFDVPQYIMKGKVVPLPCLGDGGSTKKRSGGCSHCQNQLKEKLTQLVDAVNNAPNDRPVTAEDLENLLLGD